MSEKEVEKAVEQGLTNYFKLVTKISTNNMMCFDPEGRIKKYDSPEAIIEDFYPVRLAYYQKRKASLLYHTLLLSSYAAIQDYLANELSVQLEKFTNQVRFVQMIIKKELVVSGRKKVDIVADLRRKDFKPFPKVIKKKTATELAAEEENADEEDESNNGNNANSDFDYLLGMAIWSLTDEKVIIYLVLSFTHPDIPL